MSAAAARVLLGSALRPPATLGPDPLVRLAGDVGAQGIAVQGNCVLADIAPLVAAALATGLEVPVAAAPLPSERLAPGKRIPYLASIQDRDERDAAVALVQRTIAAARDVGVRVFPLQLGTVPLAPPEAGLRRAFARRELNEGDAGRTLLDAALKERRALSPAVLDACRSSLEKVIRDAEAADVMLALPIAATPWQVATPRELITLLDEFGGAPLGVLFSPARLAVLDQLGLGTSSERRRKLREAGSVVLATDAVGLDALCLPGQGETGDLLAETLPVRGDVPVIMSGPADASVSEVNQAREHLDKLRTPAAATAGS